MNAQDFAYWLRGVFEVTNPVTLDAKQTQLIREHLDKVFSVPAQGAAARTIGDVRNTLLC